MPTISARKLWKFYPDTFPVWIHQKIHTVFFCHFVIISGKHDCRRPDLRSGKIQFPRHFTVKADLRKSKTARPCISCDRRMPFPKCRHISTKIKYILKLFFSCPVQPGNLVILTVGIIIPELSIAKLITCKEHRCPSAAKQDRKSIFHHPMAQFNNHHLISVPLCPTVPAPVIVTSIKISPSISLIMLLVIRIKIIQGKSIMAGQKIHRSMFSADSGIIDVRRTGNSLKRCSCCPKSPF